MRAAYPDAPDEADNDIREDGTACHWLASEIWNGRYPTEGSLSPNNRILTEEMFDAVDLYHDVLKQWPMPAVCENPIACDVIYPGMTGTPDAYAYDIATMTLDVADLKFGFRFVEVWENWQLIIYAMSILESINCNGLNDPFTTVRFTIVQPRSNHRSGPVRTWTVPASDLRAFVNILQHAAAKAMQDDAPCTPNPGCVDCPARHACTALQNSALTALETSYAGIPLELPPIAIGDELRRLKEAAKRIEARVTGLEMQAESLLRSGTPIPGWTLATTYARERWRDDMESQVLTLGKYYSVDLSKPQQAISPARARKLIPASVVAAYAHKPSTGVRLTKQDKFEAMKAFTTTE